MLRKLEQLDLFGLTRERGPLLARDQPRGGVE